VQVIFTRPLQRDQLVHPRRGLFFLKTACLNGRREKEGRKEIREERNAWHPQQQ